MDDFKEIPKEARWMVGALLFVLALILSVVIYVMESEPLSSVGDQTNQVHLEQLQLEKTANT